MAKTFALTNQKGGVGKTTTAINLSACLAAKGLRVLLVDVDPQANATSGVGITQDKGGLTVYDVLVNGVSLDEVVRPTGRSGWDLAPASTALVGAEVELVALMAREYRLSRALEPHLGRYDYIVIDCPPSLGLLTINALTAADGVIVPVQCEYMALEGLSQLTVTIDLVKRNLNHRLYISGLVLTMYDSRTNLSQQVVQDVRRHFPKTFEVVIPRSVRLAEAPSHGLTIFEYDSSSRGAQAYQALAEEVLAKG